MSQSLNTLNILSVRGVPLAVGLACSLLLNGCILERTISKSFCQSPAFVQMSRQEAMDTIRGIVLVTSVDKDGINYMEATGGEISSQLNPDPGAIYMVNGHVAAAVITPLTIQTYSPGNAIVTNHISFAAIRRIEMWYDSKLFGHSDPFDITVYTKHGSQIFAPIDMKEKYNQYLSAFYTLCPNAK